MKRVCLLGLPSVPDLRGFPIGDFDPFGRSQLLMLLITLEFCRQQLQRLSSSISAPRASIDCSASPFIRTWSLLAAQQRTHLYTGAPRLDSTARSPACEQI
jgi:hypothetical protein